MEDLKIDFFIIMFLEKNRDNKTNVNNQIVKYFVFFFIYIRTNRNAISSK